LEKPNRVRIFILNIKIKLNININKKPNNMALITGFIAFKAIDIIIKNKFENQ
jgi:hypothetical protein